MLTLSDAEQQVLLSVHLSRGFSEVDSFLLQSCQRQFYPKVIESDDAIFSSLCQQGLLNIINEKYQLTEFGVNTAEAISISYLPDWYGQILVRCARSEVYADFCHRVHGIAVGQYSFLSRQQIEWLVRLLTQENVKNILDVGCGSGGISAYLSQNLNQIDKIKGIDLAQVAVDYARERQLGDHVEFKLADLETFQSTETFDAILFVDTIYFTLHTKAVLQHYLKKLNKNGKIYVYYCNSRSGLEHFESILTNIEVDFETDDFTHEYTDYWQRAQEQIMILESAFHKEGNGYLFRVLAEEASRNLRYRQGQFNRKLYKISAK